MKKSFVAMIVFIWIASAAFLVATAPVKTQPKQYNERFYPRHNPIVMMQPIAYETDKEAQAAWDEFNKFAKDHSLKGGYLHPTEDSWSLALFEDGANEPKWAVYDFTNLTDAVKQIEADYTKYPKGHDPRKEA